MAKNPHFCADAKVCFPRPPSGSYKKEYYQSHKKAFFDSILHGFHNRKKSTRQWLKLRCCCNGLRDDWSSFPFSFFPRRRRPWWFSCVCLGPLTESIKDFGVSLSAIEVREIEEKRVAKGIKNHWHHHHRFHKEMRRRMRSGSHFNWTNKAGHVRRRDFRGRNIFKS